MRPAPASPPRRQSSSVASRREPTTTTDRQLSLPVNQSGHTPSSLRGLNHTMQMDLFWSDAKHAWRNTVRRPGFTLLVALTPALGIGVNSVVFALLDGVLLRPLPYRDPSRPVFLWQTLPRLNVPRGRSDRLGLWCLAWATDDSGARHAYLRIVQRDRQQ